MCTIKTKKSEANKFVTKVYNFLDDTHCIQFKKLRVNRGFIDLSVEEVRGEARLVLDPQDNIISTLIHEILHYEYPEKNESWVIKKEYEIVKKLSAKQISNILKRLASKM